MEIGNVLRVAVKWRFASAGDIVNTYHLQVAAVEVGATLQDAITTVEEWLSSVYIDSDYNSAMTGLLLHQESTVHNVSDSTLVGHTGRIAALDGDGGGEAMPPTTAPLLVLYTTTPRLTARKYLPPVTVSYVDNGHLDAIVRGFVTDMGERMLLPFASSVDMTVRPIVASADLVRIGVPSSFAVREDFAQMGSRKLGRGS